MFWCRVGTGVVCALGESMHASTPFDARISIQFQGEGVGEAEHIFNQTLHTFPNIIY